MIPPTLTDLYRSIEAEARRNSADAVAVRRAMGIDPAPPRPPFWIEIRDRRGIVYTESAGGDLCEARRKHAEHVFDAPDYTVVLTDDNKRALS